MQITAVLESTCAITNPIGRHGVADVDTSIQYVSGQNNDDQAKEGPTPPPHYHSPSVGAWTRSVFLPSPDPLPPCSLEGTRWPSSVKDGRKNQISFAGSFVDDLALMVAKG